jgi:hypothetical protein
MSRISHDDFEAQFEYLKSPVGRTSTPSKRTGSGVNFVLVVGEGHFQAENEATMTPGQTIF